MRLIFLLLLGLASCHTCLAQNSIPLYQGAVPNNLPLEKDPEHTVDRPGGGRAFFDTAIPTLTIYQPPSPNGRAIIVCPGGGYVKTAFDKEGSWVAERLVEDSITVFVLKYRIPQAKVNINPSLAPLQDAQKAIRHVRTHASAYGLNQNQIGIMGFSAGGHLAASAATRTPTGATLQPGSVAVNRQAAGFDGRQLGQGLDWIGRREPDVYKRALRRSVGALGRLSLHRPATSAIGLAR